MSFFSSVQLASVHLRVRDLARSVDFYTRQLGFVPARPAALARDLAAPTPHASLTVAPDAPALLELTEDRQAPAAPPDAAGLFHAALLLPTRAALGRWLAAAAGNGVPFDGFSDHGVSEAIYLSDPDGNGLEFYADRPRETWPFRDGELAMTTASLDVRDLLAAGAPASPTRSPLPPFPLSGAHWGHLHLRVTDLDRAEKLYSDALHFSLTQRLGPSARFLAADGYHHYLGLNNWGGVRRPLPPGALGLIEATFSVAAGPGARALQLHDSDGLSLHLRPR